MEIETTIPEILDAADHDILIMHGFIKPRALCWSDPKIERTLLANIAHINQLFSQIRRDEYPLAREIREREEA